MKYFIGILLTLSIGSALAINPGQVFLEGNTDYQEKNYNSAKEKYLEIIDSGFVSAELLFNLANAYYKLEDIPSAILYYEKALKLNPSNQDILFNLKLANLQTVDKIEPQEKLLMNKWWEMLLNKFSADRWSWMTIAFFFAAALLLSVYLLVKPLPLKKMGFFGGLTSLGIGVLCWFLAAGQNHRLTAENEGIIFKANVTVSSEPGGGNDLFVLHEGTKVEILRKTDNWIEISLSNGNSGWMAIDAVKFI